MQQDIVEQTLFHTQTNLVCGIFTAFSGRLKVYQTLLSLGEKLVKKSFNFEENSCLLRRLKT